MDSEQCWAEQGLTGMLGRSLSGPGLLLLLLLLVLCTQTQIYGYVVSKGICSRMFLLHPI